jgi:hypothetical protein
MARRDKPCPLAFELWLFRAATAKNVEGAWKKEDTAFCGMRASMEGVEFDMRRRESVDQNACTFETSTQTRRP